MNGHKVFALILTPSCDLDTWRLQKQNLRAKLANKHHRYHYYRPTISHGCRSSIASKQDLDGQKPCSRRVQNDRFRTQYACRPNTIRISVAPLVVMMFPWLRAMPRPKLATPKAGHRMIPAERWRWLMDGASLSVRVLLHSYVPCFYNPTCCG